MEEVRFCYLYTTSLLIRIKNIIWKICKKGKIFWGNKINFILSKRNENVI